MVVELVIVAEPATAAQGPSANGIAAMAPSPSEQVPEPRVEATAAPALEQGASPPAPPAPKRTKGTRMPAAQARETALPDAEQEAPPTPPTPRAALDHVGAGAAADRTLDPNQDDVAAPAARSASASVVSNPAPAYPPLARRRGLEGRVVLRVAVTSRGQAGDIAVLSSSGHTLLDDAAARAVRAWRFRPAEHRGIAVDSMIEIPIVFRLIAGGGTPITTSQAGAAE
jgi:protein TonB